MAYKNEDFPRVQFHLPKKEQFLREHLEQRAVGGLSIHAVAQRDLTAYYEELAHALPAFSEHEANFLVGALNNARIKPDTLHYLRRDVIDEAVETGNNALADRLCSLTRFEWRAVVDAVQRYWSGKYHKSEEESSQKLREVGLFRKSG